jgi:hypothetical protein
MWMDTYVQETLLREHLIDLDRRAERARLLRGARRRPTVGLAERIAHAPLCQYG